MHILARIRKREPARMSLSLRNRCISVLLAYLMIVGPAGFEQIAHASTLFSELGTSSWGEAGKVFSYCYDDNGSKTHKFYGDVDVVNNSPEDIITNNPTIAYDHHIYNLQNRLARLEKYDQTHTLTDVIEYKYNDDGVRVEKIVDPDGSAVTTIYLTDSYNHTGYAQTLEEMTFDALDPDPVNDIPAFRKTYTIGDDMLTEATAEHDGSVWTYYAAQHLMYDGHGSTRQLVTGSVGSTGIVDDFSYDGYGVLLQNEENFIPPNGTQVPGKVEQQATNLLYAGEHFDTDMQNYYLRARWYDSLSGRFNRMDPYAGNTQDPQSLHKYLYCHANPVNGLDPSGMSIIGLAITYFNMAIFKAIDIGVRCLPALIWATSIAWVVAITSGIQLILEMAGVVPQTGYTDKIFMISLIAATVGTSVVLFLNSFRGMAQPISGSKGRIDTASASNRDSMARHGYSKPPYKKATLTLEGNGASGANTVRVFKPGVSQRQGAFIMKRSDIEGIPAPMIENKYSMDYTPTHYTKVDAAGIRQRWGIAGSNFGGDGGAVQGELLEKGARFSQGIPIPIGGIPIGGGDL
jgi:RHS repeat-associated protein